MIGYIQILDEQRAQFGLLAELVSFFPAVTYMAHIGGKSFIIYCLQCTVNYPQDFTTGRTPYKTKTKNKTTHTSLLPRAYIQK